MVMKLAQFAFQKHKPQLLTMVTQKDGYCSKTELDRTALWKQELRENRQKHTIQTANIWVKQLMFKAQYFDKVICPSYVHIAYNIMYHIDI